MSMEYWPKWRDWTAAQLGFPLLKHNKLSEVSPGSIGKQANIAKENVTTLPRTENNKQQKSCCPQMQDTLGRKEFLILILICPDAVVQMITQVSSSCCWKGRALSPSCCWTPLHCLGTLPTPPELLLLHPAQNSPRWKEKEPQTETKNSPKQTEKQTMNISC